MVMVVERIHDDGGGGCRCVFAATVAHYFSPEAVKLKHKVRRKEGPRAHCASPS